MPNMQQIISSHNKSIIDVKNSADQEISKKKCNCRSQICPLKGNCLVESVVYQATVKTPGKKDETYVGLTEGTFKTRFTTHKSTFKHDRYATALSKYVWPLEKEKIPHSIEWKILAQAKQYSPSSKRCNLCITEKYFIMCRPELATLNCRNELTSVCIHRKNHLLCNFS